MKVLWFSNALFSTERKNATGTWLHTMSEALVAQGVVLANISQSDKVNKISRFDVGGIKQWVLPKFHLYNGLPSRNNIQKIQSIVESFQPDLIHIWGVESYWGLLSSRGYLKGAILLEMQGIKFSCVNVFWGGLSIKDVLSTIGIKEIVKPSLSLIGRRNEFNRWGRYEKEMLSKHDFICTQSEWVRSIIAPYIKRNCSILNTECIVRKEFLNSKQWGPHLDRTSPVVFTMSSQPHAFKGIHDVINAVSILKHKYPAIELRIAGSFGAERSFLRMAGYTRFLLRLIKKNNLQKNVKFLGAINEEQLIDEMLNADVMVQPSYVESYSLALAETMCVGLPAVVSFAGAMPELAKDNETALFYSPSDFYRCAYLINKLFDSKQLSRDISFKARELALERNSSKNIVELQIENYKSIINRTCIKG